MSESAPAALEVQLTLDAALRAFEGHFPGDPVLPGAYLLALVQDVIGRHPSWAQRVGTQPLLQQVKYLAAVRPGQTVQIRLDADRTALHFVVRCGATLVARGQFATAAPSI